MDGFVECRHPGLPKNQTAFFKFPRNGWKPIKKTSGNTARSDKPAAGESNDNKEQETSS